MNSLSHEWAAALGLASRPLFKDDVARAVLRDGVWGSFLMAEQADVDAKALDWTWSAYARHHVQIDASTVRVLNVAAPTRDAESFTVTSVQKNLEKFYVFLREHAKRVSRNVVDHVSNLLHAHMGELAKQNIPSEDAFLMFLGLLRQLSRENQTATGNDLDTNYFAEPDRVSDLLRQNQTYITRFRQELAFSRMAGRTFHSDIAIRHASGTLFQAAHHVITSEPQGALLGLSRARGVQNRALPGIHYTPTSLARALVTTALRDLPLRAEISILDPTCGSGIFLTEALFELQRRGFTGNARLIGIDISQTAIIAARFNLAYAQQEMPFNIVTNFICGDALIEVPKLGHIDCALMNPPFVPWESLSQAERESLRIYLTEGYSRRPDLAMMFVGKTFAQLAPNGRLACVLPVGVMGGGSAKEWRESLANNRILFDGVLSDHQLFEEATVSVGALVLEKNQVLDDNYTTVLWSDNQPSSSDDALRYLKRATELNLAESRITDRWGVFSIRQHVLSARGNWRPPTGRLTTILERLTEWYPDTLADNFAIRLGIRTGNRSAFVVSRAFVDTLSSREKEFVRPIAEGSNIEGGQIHEADWLIMLPSDLSERSLQQRAPILLKHLSTYRQTLEKRSSVPKNAWWTLSRMRTLHESSEPRLVSKAFFRKEGFAIDFNGRYAVVTGYAWQVRWSRHRIAGDTDNRVRLLKVFLNVLDSDIFFLLCREYSTVVSGGQVDLGPNQINSIPFPSFSFRVEASEALKAEHARMSPTEKMLAGEYLDLPDRNRLAAEYFGIPLEDWPLPES
jgi:adenine-specific DNA-methyltransferase